MLERQASFVDSAAAPRLFPPASGTVTDHDFAKLKWRIERGERMRKSFPFRRALSGKTMYLVGFFFVAFLLWAAD